MSQGDIIDAQIFNRTKGIDRMPWEKSYLEALIDHLQPFGEVLEVGFALGYSSARIQTFHPTHHTIIEPNPQVAAHATKWASNHPNISVIQAPWNEVLPGLGLFDSVFFNDFSPELAAEKTQSYQMGNQAVQKGIDLIGNTKKCFPQMMSMRYADADIDEFFENMKQFQPSQMANFLHDLMSNGQISAKQYASIISKYDLKKNDDQMINVVDEKTNPMLIFLDICLKNHMHPGSRFSCFSNEPTSKFESPEFFESIITNPNLDYQETLLPIKVPESCEYYKHNQALIMVVEKLS